MEFHHTRRNTSGSLDVRRDRGSARAGSDQRGVSAFRLREIDRPARVAREAAGRVRGS